MAVGFDVTSLHHRRATHRWERTSVGDLLERMTWSFPDQEALVGREGAYADPAFRRLTYRQADQLANQIAHALLARGLEHGDVVMLFCENSIEGYLMKIGAAKAGLVVAPMNPMMAPDMASAFLSFWLNRPMRMSGRVAISHGRKPMVRMVVLPAPRGSSTTPFALRSMMSMAKSIIARWCA